jgi:hypothetical protein
VARTRKKAKRSSSIAPRWEKLRAISWNTGVRGSRGPGIWVGTLPVCGRRGPDQQRPRIGGQRVPAVSAEALRVTSPERSREAGCETRFTNTGRALQVGVADRDPA